MWQECIVAACVLGALLFLAKGLWRKSAASCGSGACGGCGSASSCGTQAPVKID